MTVAAVARPSSLRDVAWATWILLALGGLMVLYVFTQPGGLALGTFSFVAPVFFAAAVIYAAPMDRRFVWGAVLIALAPAVWFIAGVLPDAWFAVVPGDWKNATPLLMELGDLAHPIAQVFGYIGLGLFGVALGGVRTILSVAIIGAGLLLGALRVVEFLGNPIESMPIDITVRSIVFPLLYAGGWAFVFAATLESRRILTIVGTGLLFADVVINVVLGLWPSYDPDGTVLLIYSVPVLAGWILLIAAALRGELNAPARPTSPGQRFAPADRAATVDSGTHDIRRESQPGR